jgi:5-carboxyvanillate decarboxylase
MHTSISAQVRPDYTRIATEEAFATEELFKHYRELLAKGTSGDPGFDSLIGYYVQHPSDRASEVRARLLDLDHRRICDMDASGIEVQVMALTSPGVQVFDADTAIALATSTNDELAAAIALHPKRFAGLAAIAPQNPAIATKEMDRAINGLGLKGVIINSHTRGEYLDDRKFWPIFEAAESLDVPIYLHPNTPSPAMIAPLLESGLDGAIYGFAVETGMHILRIITSGVFDRFPKLKIVVGHCGEAIPFWFSRVDFMHRGAVMSQRYECLKPLKKRPSDYFKENFYVTTSGMAWEPAIMFVRSLIGAERLLYAMDYPYQYVPEEVALCDALPMNGADKKRFFQSNAEALFKL